MAFNQNAVVGLENYKSQISSAYTWLRFYRLFPNARKLWKINKCSPFSCLKPNGYKLLFIVVFFYYSDFFPSKGKNEKPIMLFLWGRWFQPIVEEREGGGAERRKSWVGGGGNCLWFFSTVDSSRHLDRNAGAVATLYRSWICLKTDRDLTTHQPRAKP